MPLILRDYQSDLAQTLRVNFRRYRSICLQLPTGAGKTPIAGAIALGLSERGHGLLALEHRDELVDQFCRTLDTVGLSGRYGVIAAGRAPTPWARFQVASIQTLARRATPDLKPRYVVVDEAHHARAKTWAAVLDRFPDAKILGLTATPERLDGKPLGMHFEHLVCGPSIAWLVAHGWLAPTSPEIRRARDPHEGDPRRPPATTTAGSSRSRSPARQSRRRSKRSSDTRATARPYSSGSIAPTRWPSPRC